jgi:hypothetical protein
MCWHCPDVCQHNIQGRFHFNFKLLAEAMSSTANAHTVSNENVFGVILEGVLVQQ